MIHEHQLVPTDLTGKFFEKNKVELKQSAPPMPDVLASKPGDRVKLFWRAVGADSYVVRRATALEGPYEVVAPNVRTAYYEDTPPKYEIPYYYKVSAMNKVGPSPDSGPVLSFRRVQVSAVHPDAQNWCNQAYPNPPGHVKNGLSYFYYSVEAAGLREKLYKVNFTVLRDDYNGALLCFKQPLLFGPGVLDSGLVLDWAPVEGDLNAYGLKGDGVRNFGTAVNLGNFPGFNLVDCGFSFLFSELNSAPGAADFGSWVPGQENNRFLVMSKDPATGVAKFVVGFQEFVIPAAQPGLLSINLVPSGLGSKLLIGLRAYGGNFTLKKSQDNVQPAANLQNRQLRLFCANVPNTAPCSNSRLGFFAFHKGLTEEEQAVFSQIAMETARRLNRVVSWT